MKPEDKNAKDKPVRVINKPSHCQTSPKTSGGAEGPHTERCGRFGDA